jgi:hypothetical protein
MNRFRSLHLNMKTELSARFATLGRSIFALLSALFVTFVTGNVAKAAVLQTQWLAFNSYYPSTYKHQPTPASSALYDTAVSAAISSWDTALYTYPAWFPLSYTTSTSGSPGDVHVWERDYIALWGVTYGNWAGDYQPFVYVSGSLTPCYAMPYGPSWWRYADL